MPWASSMTRRSERAPSVMVRMASYLSRGTRNKEQGSGVGADGRVLRQWEWSGSWCGEIPRCARDDGSGRVGAEVVHQVAPEVVLRDLLDRAAVGAGEGRVDAAGDVGVRAVDVVVD